MQKTLKDLISDKTCSKIDARDRLSELESRINKSEVSDQEEMDLKTALKKEKLQIVTVLYLFYI